MGREGRQQKGNRFQNLLRSLERNQIEYDLGCEDILAREGRILGKKIVVNLVLSFYLLQL